MYAAFSDLDRVELTLYTDALVTRGFVRTRQRRATDILNLADDSFLILEEVAVEEFSSRGQPIRAAYAQANLDAVLFAVANVPVEPSPELRTPKLAEPAIVSVPPFTVTGMIHLLPTGGDLREALTELTGRFLPITDAVFWSEHLGEARQTALLVAVNHRRAQILAPHQEVDPWAGLDRPGRPRSAPGEPPGSEPPLEPPHPPEPPGGGW
jgi:hypothetical protein